MNYFRERLQRPKIMKLLAVVVQAASRRRLENEQINVEIFTDILCKKVTIDCMTHWKREVYRCNC